MSRRVTGTLKLPNDSPMASATLHFIAKRNEPAAIVKQASSQVTANSSGVYDVTLADGYYSVQVEYGAVRVTLGAINIYSGADTDLNTLLIADDVPLNPAAQILEDLVQQAEAAAAAAQQVGTSTALSGINFSSSAAIVAADTILQAFGKIQGRLNQLGTAANANVTVSATDTVLGRLLKVADGGWLGLAPSRESANLDNVGVVGRTIAVGGSALGNPFGTNSVVFRQAWDSSLAGFDIGVDVTNQNRIGFRSRDAGVWRGWNEIWHTATLVKAASPTDTAVGRMLQTGAGGLLGDAPNVSWGNGDYSSFKAVEAGGPGIYSCGVHVRGTANTGFSMAGRNGSMWHQSKEGGVFGPWFRVFDTGNTSANVQTMLAAANNAAIRAAIRSNELPAFTLGTVPSASASTNCQIVITDLTGGREPCFSDGTDWRRGTDRSIAN